MNFVAFPGQRQQACFLPEGGAPPPPPPRPRQPAAPSREASAAAEERANAEAQLVLRGALHLAPPQAQVARRLYAQLEDAGVTAAPATLELMVDASVSAKDLQGASDFLIKLENAGIAPGNELLDRVMELYLTSKQVGGMSLVGRVQVQSRHILPLQPTPRTRRFPSQPAEAARNHPPIDSRKGVEYLCP